MCACKKERTISKAGKETNQIVIKSKSKRKWQQIRNKTNIIQKQNKRQKQQKQKLFKNKTKDKNNKNKNSSKANTIQNSNNLHAFFYHSTPPNNHPTLTPSYRGISRPAFFLILTFPENTMLRTISRSRAVFCFRPSHGSATSHGSALRWEIIRAQRRRHTTGWNLGISQ